MFNDNSAIDRGTVVVGLVLVFTLVAGFVGTAWAGVDTSAYVLFVAGPIVSTAVGLVLGRKVAGVADDVQQVKHQTNGIATAQNAAVQAHLTNQDITAAQVATAAAEVVANSTERAAGAPGSHRPAAP